MKDKTLPQTVNSLLEKTTNFKTHQDTLGGDHQ